MEQIFRDNMLANIDDVWEDFFGRGRSLVNKNWRIGTSMPAVNIKEMDDKYSIELALPGMQKEDFKIEVKDRVLGISCEKEDSSDEKDKHYTRREFSYRSFERYFDLPDTIADLGRIEATYNKGILTVQLPKKERGMLDTVKRIEVK